MCLREFKKFEMGNELEKPCIYVWYVVHPPSMRMHNKAIGQIMHGLAPPTMLCISTSLISETPVAPDPVIFVVW